MRPCCCTPKTKPTCDFCSEGSNVLVDNGTGFLFDGETQFAGVTDSTSLFVIPTGCVVDGHSTACFDALKTGWNLHRFLPSIVGPSDCVDYFGNSIACDAVTCWWLATSYKNCPNSCTVGPDTVCGAMRLSDELASMIVVDASSDLTYVLLIVQLTSSWGRYHCCIDGEFGTGAFPLYQMRTFYRAPKSGFTCLCAVCFTKYDEQLIQGSEVPCLNMPDHIRVNVSPAGSPTVEQLANAAANCGNPDNTLNTDCAVGSGCGQAGCGYKADAEKRWILQSGVCKDGCVCPDHDALIAAGRKPPDYVNQELFITADCVAGDHPCSELLGRCCYSDESGVHCLDSTSECDCNLLGGCWNVGDVFTCDNPSAGTCLCADPVGICCYADESGGHCLDNVTEAYCSDVSSGTGHWQQQNDAGQYRCAGDRGGLADCGDVCEGQCRYEPVDDFMGGYPWKLLFGADVPCPTTGQCACPATPPTTGPGALPPATKEDHDNGVVMVTDCSGRIPFGGGGGAMMAMPMMASAPSVDESKPLSLLERAVSFTKTMASTAVTGLADDATIEARLAICQTCPLFVNGGCTKCGCKVSRDKNLLNKLAHLSATCPADPPRW